MNPLERFFWAFVGFLSFGNGLYWAEKGNWNVVAITFITAVIAFSNATGVRWFPFGDDE